MECIKTLDSHTAGEPTRVVVSGGPELGDGPLPERLRLLAEQHDEFRVTVVNEPRGSDVLVGALLLEPVDRRCAAGVIFFNNVGYLGMCGHGTIGLVTTLAYMGRIQPGEHLIETAVGTVRATLHASGRITVENVPSYRYRERVAVTVPGFGQVQGDIAWGGNWFFLTDSAPCELALKNQEILTEYTWAIRRALEAEGVTGEAAGVIDHIEVSSPTDTEKADSRNFVLCPGKVFDRSPCGTGTSAKLACLAADGKLAPGQVWRQAGILGTIFEGSYRTENGSLDRIVPSITGTAYVTSESRLILQPDDPFRTGIRI